MVLALEVRPESPACCVPAKVVSGWGYLFGLTFQQVSVDISQRIAEKREPLRC